MEPLTRTFDERLQEIDAYLDLLEALERQVQAGPPKIGGATITAQQQKILYSSVYLQLYNLVEATATWCIDAVAAASIEGGQWRAGDLSTELRREWVRTKARTHVTLNPENRLEAAVAFCDLLLQAIPIAEWSVERGGGGNWDDLEIEEFTSRLGFRLRITPAVYSEIKQKIRDDKSPLVLIKYLRNKLAHGSLSFTECGEGVTVTELKEIKLRAARYLREVIVSYENFIRAHEFLAAASRPGAGGAA